MKYKIRLDTMADVNRFVNIATKYSGKITLTDFVQNIGDFIYVQDIGFQTVNQLNNDVCQLTDLVLTLCVDLNIEIALGKLADGGVSGFLLPMTNKKEDIERVVEYAKYAPDGKRGISTTRAHTGYGVADLTEYMRTANRRMKLYAQIETRAGVENALEIASVPEVEGIFIGPNDLSCDYGCMGDNETIKRLISVICRACLTVGKPCGIITTDKDLIRHALLSGCSMVSYGSEINMLKKGAKDIRNAEFL